MTRQIVIHQPTADSGSIERVNQVVAQANNCQIRPLRSTSEGDKEKTRSDVQFLRGRLAQILSDLDQL